MSQSRVKPHHYRIAEVEEGSIASEMGVEPGDLLLEINGQEVEDVLDYRFLMHDEYLVVAVQKPSGEEWELEIEKDYDEDLGIEFENPLMDNYRSCSNRCVFCFIDQLPEGMRKTLYFKDDDSRLSFLQGNYVTLTNMSEHDIDRIIRYRLEPINISFHTLNPDLRNAMLRNKNAGTSLQKALRLRDAGIEMNGQIVLCKGINDGDELEYSLRELEQFLPALRSVSVVPVGLTRFREKLYPLEPFNQADAVKVLEQIHRWQDHFYEKWGNHVVHAGDEWYILAGQPLPDEDNYDGYPQIENGVGMIRSLHEEVAVTLRDLEDEEKAVCRRITIATGVLAAPFIRDEAQAAAKVVPGISCRVISIRNDFFGPRITVAGLITGRDLIAQLKGEDLGEELLISENMLRSGERVFLDDVTVEDVERELKIPVRTVGSGGDDFVYALLGC